MQTEEIEIDRHDDSQPDQADQSDPFGAGLVLFGRHRLDPSVKRMYRDAIIDRGALGSPTAPLSPAGEPEAEVKPTPAPQVVIETEPAPEGSEPPRKRTWGRSVGVGFAVVGVLLGGGAGAVVGPMAVIEDRSFIEPEAEISCSAIGPDTFVGQFAVIPDSFAWGNNLINWKNGWHTQVADALVLSPLRRSPLNGRSDTVLSRIAGIYSRNKDDLQMFWKHFLMNKEG